MARWMIFNVNNDFNDEDHDIFSVEDEWSLNVQMGLKGRSSWTSVRWFKSSESFKVQVQTTRLVESSNGFFLNLNLLERHLPFSKLSETKFFKTFNS